MAKEFSDAKKKNVIQKNYDNKSGVEIALWWEKNLWWTKFVMKTQKHKLWQNSKTQVMTKFKNSKCDETQKLKLWQNLETQIVTKPKKIKLRYNTKTQVKTKFLKNLNVAKIKDINSDKTKKLKVS